MADEHVHLVERPFVQEQFDTFTGGELALLVLAIDSPLAPGMLRLFTQLPQFLDAFFGAQTRS